MANWRGLEHEFTGESLALFVTNNTCHVLNIILHVKCTYLEETQSCMTQQLTYYVSKDSMIGDGQNLYALDQLNHFLNKCFKTSNSFTIIFHNVKSTKRYRPPCINPNNLLPHLVGNSLSIPDRRLTTKTIQY